MAIGIELKNCTLDFPVKNIHSYSLKKRLITASTFGKINYENKNSFVRSLENINLKIDINDRLGIIGKNGAGKSTILRVLSGVFIPQKGTVSIKGNICSLIDSTACMDNFLTGIDNINIRCSLMGIGKKKINTIIEQVAEISELGNFLNLPINTYSSGMLIRLNFSLSLLLEPEILILDEWLSTADNSFKIKAQLLMDQFVNKSKIMILASHDMDLIKEKCNRCIFLDYGKIIFDGNVKEAIDRYIHY
jgi:lipopolysaccharide transport system ATP-binding protein